MIVPVIAGGARTGKRYFLSRDTMLVLENWSRPNAIISSAHIRDFRDGRALSADGLEAVVQKRKKARNNSTVTAR